MTGTSGVDALNVVFDAGTGLTLVGWPAVAQDIREGLLTDFGIRIMREYYGSLVPRMLGESVNEETILILMASISAFLDVFEPRFRVTRMSPKLLNRLGVVEIDIEGEYLPRALIGDEQANGLERVTIQFSESGVEVQT